MIEADIILTIGNIVIMSSIFHQLYKNFETKNCRTQSYLWQIQSIIGYVLFLSGYWYYSMIIPFIGVFVNMLFKFALLIQIRYYNRENNLLETWL